MKQHCKKCFNYKRGCKTCKAAELDKISLKKIKFSCYNFEKKKYFGSALWRINSWLVKRSPSEIDTISAIIAILVGGIC